MLPRPLVKICATLSAKDLCHSCWCIWCSCRDNDATKNKPIVRTETKPIAKKKDKVVFKKLLKKKAQKAKGANQQNPTQEAVYKAPSCHTSPRTIKGRCQPKALSRRSNLRTSRGRHRPEVPYFVVVHTKRQEKTTQPKQELIQHERRKQELQTEAGGAAGKSAAKNSPLVRQAEEANAEVAIFAEVTPPVPSEAAQENLTEQIHGVSRLEESPVYKSR